ncbi:FAD:protein FMN transferase [Bdellovibrio sp. SKB1291214]|uniref:FAD:protein FMN transferase n=1 Tax=Bdellovibrio sp. SKB1291214 TaxID=1732569 RepID=UPI001C3CA212|nr:FAD:protein FMN transferase [Bdellovibrio sp. SKB1291214]UYL10584.1 FAD:protein FMN transferase [Bdellovibrio sp. SKB1291214]
MEQSQNFNIPASTLKVTAQAGRPMLGDFIQINLFSEGDYEPLLTFTLQKLAEVESILNLDDPQSEICRVLTVEGDDSFEMSKPVAEVLEKALDISALSDGFFEPFREDSRNLDLRSLIRGYMIDQAVKNILSKEQSLMGMVHLAEGIRFFNCPKKSIHVRMHSSDVEKELGLFKDAISTTESRGSLFDSESSTLYIHPLRAGLSGRHTVSVIADNCMSANVLTKIGMYAPKKVIQSCVAEMDAQIIVFGESGEIEEIFEDAKAYSFDQGHISYSSYDDSNRD